MPVWIPQALMVPGFLLLAVVGLYMCVMHLRHAARDPIDDRTA